MKTPRFAPVLQVRSRGIVAGPWLILLALAALAACVVPDDPNGPGGVTSITIDGGDRSVVLGDALTLTATVEVTGNASTTVTWTSSDEAVATIAADGQVTSLTTGTTTITATSTADPTKSHTITLTITGSLEPFACDTSGDTLTCSEPVTGVSVVVPWQGRSVEVRRSPVAGYAVSRSAQAFVLGRTLASFVVYEEGSGDLIASFDPPIEVTVPYAAADFTAAEPFVGDSELALAAWDEPGDEWAALGHGVFSQGYWVADPVVGGAFTLAGQPRFKLVGSAVGGSATASIAEATGVVALAWGGVPWDPEHAIVAFDDCTTIDEGDVTCTSAAAGLTLRVPYQGEAVNVLSIPMNKAATLTPTAFDGGEVVSTRRVLNFVVERAAAPGEWIATFDPPFEFALDYLDEDVAAALATGANERLVVGYWHEELEEIRMMGDGAASVCEGETEGCAWGEPVEALNFGYVENLDNPPGTRGGVAYGAFDTWGDRLIMVGSR